jgi:hypothetical protein
MHDFNSKSKVVIHPFLKHSSQKGISKTASLKKDLTSRLYYCKLRNLSAEWTRLEDYMAVRSWPFKMQGESFKIWGETCETQVYIEDAIAFERPTIRVLVKGLDSSSSPLSKGLTTTE